MTQCNKRQPGFGHLGNNTINARQLVGREVVAVVKDVPNLIRRITGEIGV